MDSQRTPDNYRKSPTWMSETSINKKNNGTQETVHSGEKKKFTKNIKSFSEIEGIIYIKEE